MNTVSRVLFSMVFCLVAIGLIAVSPSYGQFGGLLDTIKSVISPKSLTEGDMVSGLKEALRIGTSNAVTTVSKADGFFANPQIRIPLPDSVKKVESILRTAGFGSYIDEFELSMNRAAEKAAPQAKALFTDALGQMTFEDARIILEGGDTAATDYFRARTSEPLGAVFKPIISDSMASVGATQSFRNLNDQVRSVPFVGSLGVDLDQHVTDKSLDGLFYMLAEEEKKIRQDPAARTTDLLKRVFGNGK